MKLVALEEPTTNCGAFPVRPFALTDSSPHGDVVPIPTEPPEVAKYAEPLEVSAVVDAYGNCEAATVDDEKNTPCVSIDDEVAEVEVANDVPGVNG